MKENVSYNIQSLIIHVICAYENKKQCIFCTLSLSYMADQNSKRKGTFCFVVECCGSEQSMVESYTTASRQRSIKHFLCVYSGLERRQRG